VVLFFMFVQAGSDNQVGGATWSTKYDLAGPTPPQNVTAGIGNTLIVVNWNESTDTDKAGYRFYCDPLPGEESATPSQPNPDDDGGALDQCSSSVLIPGQEPDPANLCGSGTGTSGSISGLTNGVQYTVAVAAFDSVGNSGKLSNTACATPSLVDDFFTVYRDAGGKAGGGFCSFSSAGAPPRLFGLAMLALAALCCAIRWRRS